MGRYTKGILGPFNGKIGTVIGSTWKGIDYMRSLPKPSSKAPSQAQLEQRLKFAMGVGFLKPISSLINQGFKSVEQGNTGFNVAVAYTVKNAVTGTYPDYIIDYAKILISQGALSPVAGLSVTSTVTGKLDFAWTNNSSEGLAAATDSAVVLVYHEASSRYIFINQGSERSAEGQQLDLTELAGEDVHVWLAFASANGKVFSTSIYAGLKSIAAAAN